MNHKVVSQFERDCGNKKFIFEMSESIFSKAQKAEMAEWQIVEQKRENKEKHTNELNWQEQDSVVKPTRYPPRSPRLDHQH